MRFTLSFLLSALSAVSATPLGQYVDARICAACHPKIAETYRQTGMGRSLYRPVPAKTVEDYRNNNQFTHALSQTRYSMTERGGAYYQRRWQTGFDGKETNIEETRIDYVIGSGNHARSYLHRTATSGYIELPLSWYAEKGGSWAMSPGFDERHPPTRRFLSYECIFCHDAIPKIPPGHETPGSDPVFVGDLPEGIDCQRCHGPGGRHVGLAQGDRGNAAEIRASIVNPARLSSDRRMDLCMQCHLEPTSAEIPSLIRRFDRPPFSFVPGERLSNFVLAFDHPPGAGHDDKFEIVNSSAYRLRKSRCFIESKGALLCESCHDPHRALRGTEAAAHYTMACRQCHAADIDKAIAVGQHPAAAECTSCHMPKRRTEDVVHVVMTDHFIQRHLPVADPLAALDEQHPGVGEEYRGELVPYYPAVLPDGSLDTLYRGVAKVALRNRPDEGAVADLAREMARLKPREAEFYVVLGNALDKSGKPQEAAEAFRKAIKLRPDSARLLVLLAHSLKGSGQLTVAAEMLNRAIQLAPSSAPAWFESGALEFSLGDTPSAIRKMEKALAIDPDLAGARSGLADLLWRSGRMQEAEDQLRETLRMDPYDASAYDLIGRTLAGKGATVEALFDFEKATRLRPGYAPHLYDYALELWNVNRAEDARTSVEAALRADPNMAEAHGLLGGILAGNRQFSEAAREYNEAVRLRPDFARAHLDLARLLAAQGDMPGAIEHLRAAAAGSDPQVAQVAKQALQRIGQR